MKALNGVPNTFIPVNTYDILICIGYFIFLVAKAQPCVGKILLSFKPFAIEAIHTNIADDFETWDSYELICNL